MGIQIPGFEGDTGIYPITPSSHQIKSTGADIAAFLNCKVDEAKSGRPVIASDFTRRLLLSARAEIERVEHQTNGQRPC